MQTKSQYTWRTDEDNNNNNNNNNKNTIKARIENQNVVVTMKLCSIFCVVAPSLRRQNIKRGMMLLGGSFIGRCARNMELSAVTNGMSIPPKV